MKKTLREICTEIGVSRRAVQGYERAGLVSPAGKNKYGHLLYTQEARERIWWIHFYQEAGMSLKEIGAVIDAPLEEKKLALRKQIEKLKERKENITRLIEKLNQHIAQL